MIRLRFTIRPASDAYEVRGLGTNPFDRDCTPRAITPHMHLLGSDMKLTATYPDGTVAR